MSKNKLTCLALASSLLAACGGGGDGDTKPNPNPTPPSDLTECQKADNLSCVKIGKSEYKIGQAINIAELTDHEGYPAGAFKGNIVAINKYQNGIARVRLDTGDKNTAADPSKEWEAAVAEVYTDGSVIKLNPFQKLSLDGLTMGAPTTKADEEIQINHLYTEMTNLGLSSTATLSSAPHHYGIVKNTDNSPEAKKYLIFTFKGIPFETNYIYSFAGKLVVKDDLKTKEYVVTYNAKCSPAKKVDYNESDSAVCFSLIKSNRFSAVIYHGASEQFTAQSSDEEATNAELRTMAKDFVEQLITKKFQSLVTFYDTGGFIYSNPVRSPAGETTWDNPSFKDLRTEAKDRELIDLRKRFYQDFYSHFTGEEGEKEWEIREKINAFIKDSLAKYFTED